MTKLPVSVYIRHYVKLVLRSDEITRQEGNFGTLAFQKKTGIDGGQGQK
jgi:hypothetical protein